MWVVEMTRVDCKDQLFYFLRVAALFSSSELLMKQSQRERTFYMKLFVQFPLMTLLDMD